MAPVGGGASLPFCVPGMCWAPHKCCASGTQRAVAWPPPRNACRQGRHARGFLKAMFSCLEECRSVWRWGSGSPLSSGALLPASCRSAVWALETAHFTRLRGKCWGHSGEGRRLLSCPDSRSREGQKLLTAPFICSLSSMIMETNF